MRARCAGEQLGARPHRSCLPGRSRDVGATMASMPSGDPGSVVGCPLVESLDSAEEGLTSTISGSRRPSAPRCSLRGAARFVALQFTPIMNKDQIPRVRLCRTQESAADRLAKDLEERSQLKARLPLPLQWHAVSERRASTLMLLRIFFIA